MLEQGEANYSTESIGTVEGYSSLKCRSALPLFTTHWWTVKMVPNPCANMNSFDNWGQLTQVCQVNFDPATWEWVVLENGYLRLLVAYQGLVLP